MLAPIAAAVAAVTGVGEEQVEVTASAASVLLTILISGFENEGAAAASLPKFAEARLTRGPAAPRPRDAPPHAPLWHGASPTSHPHPPVPSPTCILAHLAPLARPRTPSAGAQLE